MCCAARESSGKLVALITGIPAEMGVRTRPLTNHAHGVCVKRAPRGAQVYGKEVQTVEINFLCVHKKLRSKRLAPVLIKEVTRRINHTGVFQAVYTAGVVRAHRLVSVRA